MDPSTKGLTTEITAAGLNRQPKQTQLCLLLTVFQSRLELSDGRFSRLNWFQRRTLPQQMSVKFAVRTIRWYCNSFLLSAGRVGEGFFSMKRPVGERIHVAPAFAFTHTCSHLLSPSFPLFLLCFVTPSFLSMATSHSQQGDYLFLWVDLPLSVGIWENGTQNDRMSTHSSTHSARDTFIDKWWPINSEGDLRKQSCAHRHTHHHTTAVLHLPSCKKKLQRTRTSVTHPVVFSVMKRARLRKMSKGIWKKSRDLIPWSGDGNLNGWILSVWNVWVPDSQPGCHSYFNKSCQCPSPGILSNQPRFQEEVSNTYSFPIPVLAQMRIKIKFGQKPFLLHILSNMKAEEISCKISLKFGETPSTSSTGWESYLDGVYWR